MHIFVGAPRRAKHTIPGSKVHVYKRRNSRFRQCSIYLAGRNRRVSAKQESLQLAKEFAEDWYTKASMPEEMRRLRSAIAVGLAKWAAERFCIERLTGL